MKPVDKSITGICMDTLVSLQAVSRDGEEAMMERLNRALEIFYVVERACSRFDPDSEVRQLLDSVGKPFKAGDILFEAARFACRIAEKTDGAFDPSIGAKLEEFGFNRNYLTGAAISSGVAPDASANYRDIHFDERERTITLDKALVLDLGAVAKGLAADLAKKELEREEGFWIDAGGDLLVGGKTANGDLWRIGIRNPLKPHDLSCVLQLTDAAVCTSGNYERKSRFKPNEHHLVHALKKTSRSEVVSCTVVAPYAMMADAVSTAAFLLGVEKGLSFIEAMELDGLIITADSELHMTKNMEKVLL